MDIETSYKTLALDPGSPFKEIKMAYITKVKQYHPDQFNAESANHHLAENKLKEINLAFETLMRYFKIHTYDTERQTVSPVRKEIKKRMASVSREPVQDSAAHPDSLKKARALVKKTALDDADISHLFMASDLEYRHARLRANSTLTSRMDEIMRTENEISRHQELYKNKYFKKGVFDISREHRFSWKELKKRFSISG